MKKLITTILALTLLSAFSMSCSKGFSFYDLGGTWKSNSGNDTFSIDTSAKTINKNNKIYTISGDLPETKAQTLTITFQNVDMGTTLVFTSKTEANGTGDFNGAWTKQ